MAESEGVYNDNIHVLKKVMGLMMNNKQFSDSVFTVKNKQFFVLSQLLSASSTILDELITTHYEHCQDKDLKIYNVKYEDSFLLILKYIYGQPLDFQKAPVHIICEVLCLAERYKLSEFHNDLKLFLCKLNCFELESAVLLLNTANKYNISKLYERLILFAYEHAEQLVKHETFPDLDYTVLTDLVKSDWFACSEIDILTGVLTWHSGMDEERKNCKTPASQDNDLDLKQKDTCNSTDNSEQLVEMKDTLPEVMHLFSENILKSLLAQIRYPVMFASDLVKTVKTDLGKNYIDFLMDENYFSQISKPRQKYQAQSIEVVNDVQKIFHINDLEEMIWDTMYESDEVYVLGDLKWNICIMCTQDDDINKDIYVFGMYLECIYDDNHEDWEYTVEFQLKWISHTNLFNSMILPDENSYKTLTLTADNSCVKIGEWEVDYDGMNDNVYDFTDWRAAYEPDHISTFHLDIKSMQMKMNFPIKEIYKHKQSRESKRPTRRVFSYVQDFVQCTIHAVEPLLVLPCPL